MKPEPFASYLAARSARGPWTLDLDSGTNLPGAIVIPALAELATLPLLLDSLAVDGTLPQSGLAVVFVVNNRTDASSKEKENNLLSLDYLQSRRNALPFPLGLIDAASPGFELPLKDGGVGLARKLGHDLLLPFLDFSQSDPVIISLDADTVVSPGYAGAIMDHFRSASAGGAVIGFEHLPAEGEREKRAIERYELFLRCYVAGLSFAGSPYAFHTVGSAMACRASAYLKCGGMNRRCAGEDFYFLQSLAKTAGVEQVKGTFVYPSPRRSARVPFGTGRAMSMMLDGETAIRFYRPECYELLRDWLQLARYACSGGRGDLFEHGKQLSASLGSFLEGQKFMDAWRKFLGQHSTPEALESAFHSWFDAFRTMKLFHFLAETEFPRGEPEDIVNSFPEAWGEPGLSLGERLEYLRMVQSN